MKKFWYILLTVIMSLTVIALVIMYVFYSAVLGCTLSSLIYCIGCCVVIWFSSACIIEYHCD